MLTFCQNSDFNLRILTVLLVIMTLDSKLWEKKSESSDIKSQSSTFLLEALILFRMFWICFSWNDFCSFLVLNICYDAQPCQ